MPCPVKKTFEIARDTGNHLLVQLKANQANLFDAIRAIADNRVTRRALLYSAATGLWDQRGEVAFHVSSADGFPATEWATAIRGHWGIENRNHYVRDVSCDEDKSRIRGNPGIMARARSFALSIMRTNGITNVDKALWNGALATISAQAVAGLEMREISDSAVKTALLASVAENAGTALLGGQTFDLDAYLSIRQAQQLEADLGAGVSVAVELSLKMFRWIRVVFTNS